MTIGHVNIKTTIEKIQKELKDNKNISPVLSSSIELLIVVIQMLVDRQSMNSTNSSLPPASDQRQRRRAKDKKKRKKKGQKSIGGQPGHEGVTLTQYEDPDEVIELSIDRRTLPAGENFKACDPETRQVIDLNLEFIVTEYQAEVLEDNNGKRYVATFPSHITKAIQYGPSVKSLAVYMSQYQLLPYARVQEVFKDQFDSRISQGSLCNFNKEAFDKFEDYEKSIIKQLKNKDVLNTDETGVKVDSELAWVHVLCTPTLTFMVPHKKRGKKAMRDMGIIPNYKGVLVHDHCKPYLGYECEHALCNAHHLRELQWVIDFKDHKWAKSMKRLLLNLNKLLISSLMSTVESSQKIFKIKSPKDLER